MSGAHQDAERGRVEELLPGLPHQEAIRPDGGQVSFDAAWELRVFALAVAAHRGGRFDWPAFQQALVAAIARWERSDGGTSWRYYDRWLEALEDVLAEKGALDVAELDERTHAVLTTPRDASHQRARREPVAVDAARR